jgi:hypothetical protein
MADVAAPQDDIAAIDWYPASLDTVPPQYFLVIILNYDKVLSCLLAVLWVGKDLLDVCGFQARQ